LNFTKTRFGQRHKRRGFGANFKQISERLTEQQQVAFQEIRLKATTVAARSKKKGI
jgi:hypothetical protein